MRAIRNQKMLQEINIWMTIIIMDNTYILYDKLVLNIFFEKYYFLKTVQTKSRIVNVGTVLTGSRREPINNLSV